MADVIKIEDIKKYADGQEVDIPGYELGTMWRVKLKRPSLINLAASGSIPNPLLNAAADLFTKGIKDGSSTGEKFKDMASVMRIEAKAALAEPTYQELKDAGIELTDSQLLYIHNYVITGVDTLSRFRTDAGLPEDLINSTGTTDHSEPRS